MNWAFGIKSKLKASLILFLLCLVILFGNFRLQNLAKQVTHSVETIYRDRLMVQDLIFSYSRLLEGIEEVNELGLVDGSALETYGGEAKQLNTQYLATKLTDEESVLFNDFSEKLNTVFAKKGEAKPRQEAIDAMKKDLTRLEAIQMEEAKKQMTIIEGIGGDQKRGFYIGTAILVVLLLAVQVTLMNVTLLSKPPRQENFNLN